MSTRTPSTAVLARDLRESVSRLVRRLRAAPGPPLPQLTVLSRLDRGGPAGISDLAAAQHMRPQSMAQTIGEMENAGLVTRRPDPADGRRAFIELTSAGLELLHATRAAREDWLIEALNRQLDKDEREQLRASLALIDRVVDG